MHSTSLSKESLVRVQGLNLVLRPDFYRSTNWRDLFVRFSKSPLETIVQGKDRLHLLKDISFDVQPGDRIGLLGVNGTGKTTLCRCIAGIYQPSTGTVQTRGRVQAVFDTSVGLNPELTGRENAHLMVEFLYPTDSDRHRMADEALTFADLREFADAPFRLYSNGMQARLCLSLVSCKPWDILILDEVFAGADAFFRDKIAARILKMIENSGAVIFVSHSAEEIRKVCNRVIILDQGHLVFDGAVEEGLRRYESR